MLLVGASLLSSCQSAKIGAACRTPGAWGETATQILRCQNRRWVRVISKADYARLILANLAQQQQQQPAVQGETETRPAPPAPVPQPQVTSPPPTDPPATTTTTSTSTTSTTTTTTLPSSTEQNTFRVVYLVPEGVTPDPVIPGAINHELGLVSAWYKLNTGKAPRFFRTPGGAIQVDTVTIPWTREQLSAEEDGSPTGRYDVIRPQLESLGYVDDEADLVYVDFQSAVVCGEAVKDLALVYLSRGSNTGGCGRTNPAAPSTKALDDTLVTTAHELTHAFGAAQPCAPNYDTVHPSHVDDGSIILLDEHGDPVIDPDGTPHYVRQDILYWNPAYYLFLDDFDLDKDHADYFGHGSLDCADIGLSARWE